jgi:hypothetical protein
MKDFGAPGKNLRTKTLSGANALQAASLIVFGPQEKNLRAGLRLLPISSLPAISLLKDSEWWFWQSTENAQVTPQVS